MKNKILIVLSSLATFLPLISYAELKGGISCPASSQIKESISRTFQTLAIMAAPDEKCRYIITPEQKAKNYYKCDTVKMDILMDFNVYHNGGLIVEQPSLTCNFYKHGGMYDDDGYYDVSFKTRIPRD